MSRSIVCGFGINDADYKVNKFNGTKWVRCPYYSRWKSMIRRCYDKNRGKEHAAYSECLVDERWSNFSQFRTWMEKQDWRGKHLDKDILITGNKVYSPEACIFIDDITNTFLTTGRPNGVTSLMGAIWDQERGMFQSRCNNPFTKKADHLGRYKTDVEAHEVWRRRKHELACQLADLQPDIRVARALRVRYAT